MAYFYFQLFSKVVFMPIKSNKTYFYLWTYGFFVFLLLLESTLAQSNNSSDTALTVNISNPSLTTNVTTIPIWLQNSTSQLQVFMNDKYNYFVTSNGNKVWVCAMNLAWNQVKREFLNGQNPQFSNMTSIQSKIVENLNLQLFTQLELSDDSYYVGSGYGKDALKKMRFQFKRKFPDKPFPSLRIPLKDSDFLALAVLQKNFLFKTSFSEATGFRFKKVVVEGFQWSNPKQRKQLYYKYYRNSSDFLMGIQSKNKKDEILLLRSANSDIKLFSIDKVLKLIDMYEKMPNLRFRKIDMFAMPVLDFNFTRNYPEMTGLKFSNPGYNNSVISQMHENLKVKITKNGVQVYEEASLTISRTSMAIDPKFFFLDSDFWLILKQKDKKPYLIMSVTCVKETWEA